MHSLQFLYGSNLKEKNPEIKPGAIYLDLATGELFYDDPSNVKTTHEKIIDTATLIYTITDSIIFPSEDDSDNGESSGGSTSAVLGVAVLGSMVLGTP